MQNSIQNGTTLIYVPDADVKGGDLIIMKSSVGVAITDIATGESGALAMCGVFQLDKGNTTAFEQGQLVYAKADGTFATEDTDNVKVGIAWEESTASDDSVMVKIN